MSISSSFSTDTVSQNASTVHSNGSSRCTTPSVPISHDWSGNEFRRFLDPTHFSFPCFYPRCNCHFKLTAELYDHIRAHPENSERLVCPFCRRFFGHPGHIGMSTFVSHVRTHTGCKPYVCPLPLCRYRAASKGCLKAHLLSQTHKAVMSEQLFGVIFSMDIAKTDKTSGAASKNEFEAQIPPKKRRRKTGVLDSMMVDTQYNFELNMDTSRYYQSSKLSSNLENTIGNAPRNVP